MPSLLNLWSDQRWNRTTSLTSARLNHCALVIASFNIYSEHHAPSSRHSRCPGSLKKSNKKLFSFVVETEDFCQLFQVYAENGVTETSQGSKTEINHAFVTVATSETSE